MPDRDIGLEYRLADRQKKLKRLKDRIALIDKEIEEGVDFEEERKLETRKDNIFDDLSLIAKEIVDMERQLQQQAVQEEEAGLLTILKAEDGYRNDIDDAYRTTTSVWQTSAPSEARSAPDILKELNRLGQNENGYTALEAFVAWLINITASSQLRTALSIWGNQYYPERVWLDLYEQIQDELKGLAKDYQPAILIELALAEEEGPQNNNEPYYHLRAWLVKDLESYQEHRTGFEALISPGTPNSEPFLLDNLEDKIQAFLERALSKARDLMLDDDKDPEFYIFLPMALLGLGVDYWPLGGRSRLGQDYPVVICCAERWEGARTRKPWHTFWKRHQDYSASPAQITFEELSFTGIDDIEDLLEDAIDKARAAKKVVGLKICAVPCPLTSNILFDEMLHYGLPLALWGRCDKSATSIVNKQELDQLLKLKSLGELPQTIKSKREEARQSKHSPDRHIGHHLSFLRDNPNLPLPARSRRKSAQL